MGTVAGVLTAEVLINLEQGLMLVEFAGEFIRNNFNQVHSIAQTLNFHSSFFSIHFLQFADGSHCVNDPDLILAPEIFTFESDKI